VDHHSRPGSTSQPGQKPKPDPNTLGVYLWVDMCIVLLYESGVILEESVCMCVCRMTIDYFSSDLAVFLRRSE
jgi:hypothetical protein